MTDAEAEAAGSREAIAGMKAFPDGRLEAEGMLAAQAQADAEADSCCRGHRLHHGRYGATRAEDCRRHA